MNTNRYNRQILLKEIGEKGQKKLLSAKVLVIGAGGLGCPALQYLAAAGVGTIGIVDFDVVDISNLQRQIVYITEDVGKPKAETAAKRLRALNPEITIQAHHCQLTNKNALSIFSDYDLIVDGSDNFATRYLVNDACVLLDKALVYGAVLRFEGQVGVFNLLDKESGIKVNYRDLFPEPPDPLNSLSCNEAGVLGILPGIIGTLQATEAMKIITGAGKILCNKLVTYNALQNTFFKFNIQKEESKLVATPRNEVEYKNFNYEWFCSAHSDIPELSVEKFDEIRKNENLTIIDVRESGEMPTVTEFPFTLIPLSEFENTITSYALDKKTVIYCKSGVRSLKAANIVRKKFPLAEVYNLTGGIEAWKRKNKKFNE